MTGHSGTRKFLTDTKRRVIFLLWKGKKKVKGKTMLVRTHCQPWVFSPPPKKKPTTKGKMTLRERHVERVLTEGGLKEKKKRKQDEKLECAITGCAQDLTRKREKHLQVRGHRGVREVVGARIMPSPGKTIFR